jgi:AcrR family transcriptional regulator
MTTAAPLTARARARAEITAEITAEARRQLAVDGAAGLSVRAVARELGMVSSGIYRYVANRDELLTMLIIEAYDSLGEAAEVAARRSLAEPGPQRLVAVARAIRKWALKHPHEYALVYGSPVPGYEAPQDTVGPATRVSLALVGVIADAHRDGALRLPRQPEVVITPALAADLDALRRELSAPMPDQVLARLLIAWTQLFGMISFELFGQTRNIVDAHDDLLEAATLAMAAMVGLR